MLPCLYSSSSTSFSYFSGYVEHDVIFIEQKSMSKSSERIFTDDQHLRNVHYRPWFRLKLKCITFYCVVGVFERAWGLFGSRWSLVNCIRIFIGKKFAQVQMGLAELCKYSAITKYWLGLVRKSLKIAHGLNTNWFIGRFSRHGISLIPIHFKSGDVWFPRIREWSAQECQTSNFSFHCTTNCAMVCNSTIDNRFFYVVLEEKPRLCF